MKNSRCLPLTKSADSRDVGTFSQVSLFVLSPICSMYASVALAQLEKSPPRTAAQSRFTFFPGVHSLFWLVMPGLVQTWKDTEDRAHLTKPWTFLMWKAPPELFSQAPWTATTKKWPFSAYSILEEMLTACQINCALVKFNHDSLSFHWVSRDPWGTAQV